MDISDEVLRDAVNEILKDADLKKMTLRKVMLTLTERFGTDSESLAPLKKSVRAFIEEYLSRMDPPSDDEDGEEEDTAESEAAEEDDETKNDFEDDSDGQEKRVSRKRNKRARAPSPKAARLTGLTRAVILSQPLADLLGEKVLPRHRIQQRIIAYAKERDLQDPSDRRVIVADDALRSVFKVSKFSFFSLSKYVAEHVESPADCDDADLKALAVTVDSESLAELEAKRADDIANGVVKPSRKLKKRKGKSTGRAGTRSASSAGAKKDGRGSGLTIPMRLSPELAAVCGGEDTMSRPQVVKALWSYVKGNGLQDPNDGRRVLCDDALAAVFDGERVVSGFSMNKYLSAHLSKLS